MRVVENVEDISAAEYELFRKLVYEHSGINLGGQKMQLVRARLGKRLRQGEFKSYRDYYEYVRKDASGRELCALIDAISTNTTHLFREKQHFEFLGQTLRSLVEERGDRGRLPAVRIWSAACSSGEEAYSIAMTAHDALSLHAGMELKILATDISTNVLERARQGVFERHRLGTVPESFRRRYFMASAQRDLVRIVPELQRLITFARLNLIAGRFPFRQPFEFIFCRNVMIYFDRPTQATLVNRLAEHLRPGGYLLIGHSESLNSISHPLTYIRPTIYQRRSA
jgi:chemotaxis protein methyltransferase CheR